MKEDKSNLFNRIKKPLQFSLLILPFSAVGGYFIGLYTYNAYRDEIREEILKKVQTVNQLCLITMFQSSLYAFLCSFFGYQLSVSINLMKPIHFERSHLLKTSLITFISGLIFSSDYFVFVPFIPQLESYYSKKITLADVISSILYGGFVEEIMMRLFLMSLISFIIWKVFARKYPKEIIPSWVFITANVISASLFAALHIPATINLFGKLTPIILFRCFLLNGMFGLVFGRFYRKYGIQYSILSHAGIHAVSKLIMIFTI